MNRKGKNNPWESCTWSGARHEQLRRWSKLSLREKLMVVEEMGELARIAKNSSLAAANGAKNLTRFEKALKI